MLHAFPSLFSCGVNAGTRLAVTIRGDEPYEELDILKNVDDITMVLHNLPYNEEKISRVHAARRQVIHCVEFINLFY